MNNYVTTEKGTKLYLMNLKGKDYLEVKYRILWFHEKYPDGTITTELLFHDLEKGIASFLARVSLGDLGRPNAIKTATGHGMETRTNFKAYFQKAETIAIGRALAHLGIGTTQALELEESPEDTLADAPVERVDKVKKLLNPEDSTTRQEGEKTWPKKEQRKQRLSQLKKDLKWSSKDLKRLVNLVGTGKTFDDFDEAELSQLEALMSFGPSKFNFDQAELVNGN